MKKGDVLYVYIEGIDRIIVATYVEQTKDGIVKLVRGKKSSITATLNCIYKTLEEASEAKRCHEIGISI